MSDVQRFSKTRAHRKDIGQKQRIRCVLIINLLFSYLILFYKDVSRNKYLREVITGTFDVFFEGEHLDKQYPVEKIPSGYHLLI